MMAFTNMRSGVFASVSAHVLLVLVAQFGLPHFFTPPPVSITIIPVDLVTIDDINAPPPPAAPEPEPEPEVAAPPPPPPEAPPEPPAEPEPEVVEAPPPPPVEKPKPPQKEPEKVEPKPTQLAKAKPLSKPKPPKPPKPEKDFSSVLKDLANLKTTPTTAPKTQEPSAPKDKGKQAPTPPQISDTPSITEVERLKQMIREQIEPCWSPPVGAAGAEELAISIFIRVDQRGFVSEARILDAEAMANNPFVQAAADAARRAVLNPRCQPFQLPQKRYDLWKEIRFNFDPREMLG